MAWPRTLWYRLAAAGILGFFGPDYALTVGAKQGLPMVMQVALRFGAKANKRDVPSSATVSTASFDLGCSFVHNAIKKRTPGSRFLLKEILVSLSSGLKHLNLMSHLTSLHVTSLPSSSDNSHIPLCLL